MGKMVRPVTLLLKNSLVIPVVVIALAFLSGSAAAGEGDKSSTEETVMKMALRVGPEWPEKDLDTHQFGVMLMEAVKAAHVETIPEEKTKAIEKELRALVVRFVNNRDSRTDAYLMTAQILVYFYLTKPKLSEQDAALLKSQHERLFAFVDKLPERMIAEFHVPADLRKETEEVFALARKDLEEIVTSDFYRFAQTPMPEKRFVKMMDTLASETLAMGKQTANYLDDLRPGNPRYAGRQDKKRLEREKRTKLTWALDHVRATAVSFYGTAAGHFVNSHVNSDWSVFPFGGQKSYGTLYRKAGKGILFHIAPADNQPASAEFPREKLPWAESPRKNPK
jgi:hypothetical protein